MAATSQNIARRLWHTLSAVRTGVILLIVTVIVSAAGTLILQRPITEPEELERAYSPSVLRFMDATGLTNVYHAWWFLLLLVLVSLSIVAASVQRFPNAWRFFSRPYKSPDLGFRRGLPLQKLIPIEDEETAVVVAAQTLRKFHLNPELVTTDKTVSLFAERNRLSEMAVYVVHASLLLIFAGGIIDGLWGWHGSINLSPGQQTSEVVLRDGATRTLPFAIRCDGAGQENYSDGSPKRWWSNLAVVKAGQQIQSKQIVVNDPLVYGGVRFYQASFGATGKVESLLLTAEPAKGGEKKEISLSEGTPVELDADTTVRLAEFIPDFVVRDGQVYTRSTAMENPAARLIVESKVEGKSYSLWLPPMEGIGDNASAPYSFEPKDLKMVNFTGLQVSHEPGQWPVWAGVILMGVGLAFVFYLMHVRYWVVPLRDARGNLVLWVGGASNKNREAFRERFDHIVSELENNLQAQSNGAFFTEPVALAGD